MQPKALKSLGTPCRLSRFSLALFLAVVWFTQPAHAQLLYTVDNGGIVITGYDGPGGDVTIPATIDGLPVTSIASSAFEDQTSLINVTLPDSITSIGDSAFRSCRSLINVTLPNNITSIGNSAFRSCRSLTNVTLPNSITNIGEYAFYLCNSLRTAIIPPGVTAIERATFSFCWSLTNITIPDSVTGIGAHAFSWCSNLTRVMIPVNVRGIGSTTFGACTSLTAIEVDAQNPHFSSRDGVLFNKSQSTIVKCPGAKPGDYIVPDTVAGVAPSAFAFCPNLTSITFPGSVTIVEYSAFDYCYNLTAIYFRGDAPWAGGTMFNGTSPAIVYFLPGTTGWESTFSGSGRPTALWLPRMAANRGGPGDPFGFTISWASGKVVVVEACNDLTTGNWSALGTNTLGDGLSYFSDPSWTSYPSRFYRLRSQE